MSLPFQTLGAPEIKQEPEADSVDSAGSSSEAKHDSPDAVARAVSEEQEKLDKSEELCRSQRKAAMHRGIDAYFRDGHPAEVIH